VRRSPERRYDFTAGTRLAVSAYGVCGRRTDSRNRRHRRRHHRHRRLARRIARRHWRQRWRVFWTAFWNRIWGKGCLPNSACGSAVRCPRRTFDNGTRKSAWGQCRPERRFWQWHTLSMKRVKSSSPLPSPPQVCGGEGVEGREGSAAQGALIARGFSTMMRWRRTGPSRAWRNSLCCWRRCSGPK
jgi:hypothetical protein